MVRLLTLERWTVQVLGKKMSLRKSCGGQKSTGSKASDYRWVEVLAPGGRTTFFLCQVEDQFSSSSSVPVETLRDYSITGLGR